MIARLLSDGWRMLWPILIAAGLSLAIKSLWPLCALLLLLLSWQVWQKWRLARWLARGDLLDPPHASGLWEDYYTRLMHLFRKEQRAQQTLSAIIERARYCADALDEGVLLLDNQGLLVYYNATACQLLGLGQHDHGEALSNFVRHPLLHHYIEAGNFQQPLVFPAPQQQKIHLQVRVTALQKEGMLLRVADISPVEKLESLRRDFVANVSHELKTPITVFKGSLELFAQLQTEPQSPASKLLQTMQQQSDRMELLVSDLLLLARLESRHKPNVEKIAVNRLCDKLQNTFALKAEQKAQQLHWHIAPDLHCYAAVDELESAFSNLISNAIHYTPSGGEIRIDAYQKDQRLYFSVSDNGPGIDEAHLPYLTERFYRVDKSRSSSTGGTGLGLAIVKHVLQRYQGQLIIESTLGKGSRFTCCLPTTVRGSL